MHTYPRARGRSTDDSRPTTQSVTRTPSILIWAAQLNWIIIRSVFVVTCLSLPQKATSTRRRYATGMTAARPAPPTGPGRAGVCQFVEQSSHQEIPRSSVGPSAVLLTPSLEWNDIGMGIGSDGGLATRSTTIIEEWRGEQAVSGNRALRRARAHLRRHSLRSIENWFDRHCRYRLSVFLRSLSVFFSSCVEVSR